MTLFPIHRRPFCESSQTVANRATRVLAAAAVPARREASVMGRRHTVDRNARERQLRAVGAAFVRLGLLNQQIRDAGVLLENRVDDSECLFGNRGIHDAHPTEYPARQIALGGWAVIAVDDHELRSPAE